METKQKTWEDCCDEVAKDNGWDDWECVLISKMSLESKSILTKKAAELFNQETAKERDSYKSGAEQWKATSKYQEDEINQLREEREKMEIEIQVQKSQRSIAEHRIEYFQKLLDNETAEIPKLQDFASRHGDAEGYARGCGQLVLLERIKKTNEMVTCTQDCEGECGDVCPVILANKELIKFKDENERLKRLISDLTGNSITSYSDAIEYTKIRKERDSLKQLNSELVKSLDEIIRYYERHYRVPYVWQPYKMAKEAFSKASDVYTKAKD